ncbi:MAG TPA: hypothetical protein VJ736_11800, partial [Actinomycetota bacterium]|nr:hypothetical protein [Actinomycetota bacterium]
VSGGGIWNGGVLTMDGSSSVTANVALSCGNSCGRGGGIDNFIGSTLTMNDASIVSGNTSRQAGGIWNGADLTLNGSSSVAGNSATGKGGGVVNENLTTITMNDSSTVTGNTADADDSGRGAGGGIVDRCHVTLNNVIAGGNVNDNYRGTAHPMEDNISHQNPCAG